ncbi:hypothetical protein NLG97_g7760 [Lecanicillium saksenae]|uniref:Uncharacterized protein n=1 Tax=Lecanicillium saksenae TaxID=468837 RepID=A0ACC1QM12_9HYPO|nr:hypothetical protein NLG97_g7760 [Lecanicillium saksenae]
MSTERILVHESIKDAFAARVVETATAMYGRPGQDAPVLIMESAVSRNTALMEDAVGKGARVLYGDVAAAEDSKTRMRPIIIADVTPDMKVYKTESFGPTVAIISFKTEEEAVAVANDTEYGLAAAIFDKDLRRAMAVANRIETGAVHINAMTVHDEAALPHGGTKESGYGRFGGGFDEWTRTKTITFDA